VSEPLPPLVPTLLDESKTAGSPLAPTKLLSRIRELENPVHSMGGWDSGNAIFGPLREDFDFVAFARVVPDRLTLGNRNTWIGLLRWLWQGLAAWRADSDPKLGQLVALLAVAEYCNFYADEWARMPDCVGENMALMDTLVELNTRFTGTIEARKGAREPLWERETVEKFLRAEKENDWLIVSELWPMFENNVFVNTFQAQLLRCLCRFDSQRLLEALARVDNIQIAFMAARALTTRDRLNIGAQTGNAKVRFACVFSTFYGLSRLVALEDDEQSLLAEILAKVAADAHEWRQWMAAFNRFPVRYPLLQNALGKALSSSSDSAFQAYIDSVHLFPDIANCRQAIGICLQAFADSAPPNRKRLMWTLAFKRWSEWKFGAAKDQYMFQIAWSDFDYAIVAYCLECLDEDTRRQNRDGIIRDICTVEDRWHGSFSDFVTERNRGLSALQPYAHADVVSEKGGSYLASGHYSTDNPSDRYVRILARLR